jgi:GxxExxY protein
MNTETQSRRVHDGVHQELTGDVIAAAIEVHRELGPGLFESVNEECFCRELALRGIPFPRQIELPVIYKGLKVDCAYRLDVIVEEKLVVEVKAVESLLCRRIRLSC